MDGKTTDERLAAVEQKQDEVIHLLQTAGGELQSLGKSDLRGEEFDAALRRLVIRIGGVLKSIKGRGH
jgi:hypothetical protein